METTKLASVHETTSQYLAYIPPRNIKWNILQYIKIISAFPFESDQITPLIFVSSSRVVNHSSDETYIFTKHDGVLRNNCAKIGVCGSFRLIYKRWNSIAFCSHHCLFRGFPTNEISWCVLHRNLILRTILLRVFLEYSWRSLSSTISFQSYTFYNWIFKPSFKVLKKLTKCKIQDNNLKG